jgi:membrane-associated protease RseP (regulator of RpoE activity)
VVAGQSSFMENRAYTELTPALAPTELERARFPWLNVILFFATVLTTLAVGATLMASYQQELSTESGGVFQAMWERPSLLLAGLPFSASLLSILMAHEMGHYLTCRYYGISATLPYFIPAPTLIGTFGAFIRIRSPIHNRRALLDVGIAGPIAGFVLALPILALALTQSRYMESGPDGSFITLGEPLIFRICAFLMGAEPPPGMELYLHPIGVAAWVGLLVTQMNLIPVGQLDGGHIAYALFRGFHKRISQAFVFVLLPLGIFYWPGWLVWVFLLAMLGTRHPPTLDDSAPLEPRHTTLGWIALLMFVLCFMPAPVTIS